MENDLERISTLVVKGSYTIVWCMGLLFFLLRTGRSMLVFFFFLNEPAPPEISPFPLPAALPISRVQPGDRDRGRAGDRARRHDPSADPRTPRAPQAGARPLDDPDLARPQRDGGDVRFDEIGRAHV